MFCVSLCFLIFVETIYIDLKMKRFFCAAFFAAFFSVFSASAQTADEEYRELTKEYLKLSSFDATIEAIVPQMIEHCKSLVPEAPESLWISLFEKFKEKFTTDKVVEPVAEIYAKYFSKQEMKEIVAFYKSPVGKKMSAVTPDLTKDCMEWGKNLGIDVAKEILNEVKEKGYKVNM